MVPLDSLGTVSYSHSLATVTVSSTILDIYSVKEWLDLKYGFGVGQDENGDVRQTIYDVLLVGHCNYSSILYHFRVIWR